MFSLRMTVYKWTYIRVVEDHFKSTHATYGTCLCFLHHQNRLKLRIFLKFYLFQGFPCYEFLCRFFVGAVEVLCVQYGHVIPCGSLQFKTFSNSAKSIIKLMFLEQGHTSPSLDKASHSLVRHQNTYTWPLFTTLSSHFQVSFL